jgi:ADP-heptose:LPS heptosyltransferase
VLAILKRKFFSAISRLKTATTRGYQSAITHCVEALTERYWLLDYWPVLKQRQQTMLLVRLDLIGDFILWLDSAQRYRKIYPNHKIVLAVNRACLELAQTLPYWDDVIAIEISKLRDDHLYRLRTLHDLRRRNFAIALQPTFSRELIGDLAIRATNAKQRIGYFGDQNNISYEVKAITDKWYTTLIEQDTSCVMELNKNAHFVRQLGDDDFLSNIPAIPSLQTLRGHLALKQPYIVIAPGASWQPKMWPAANFATLIEKLTSQFHVEIVLCGGPGDMAICDELLRLLPQQRLSNFVGQTSLVELIEVIRNATMLVSNDSSPIHIAAATQTPSVCVLGGGHFGRFLPYAPEQLTATCAPVVAVQKMDCFGCNWRCTYKITDAQAVPCIASVSAASVFDACLQTLANLPTKLALPPAASTAPLCKPI